MSSACKLLRFPPILVRQTELDVTSATWVKMDCLTFLKRLVFDVPERLVVSLRCKRLGGFPRLKQFIQAMLDVSP